MKRLLLILMFILVFIHVAYAQAIAQTIDHSKKIKASVITNTLITVTYADGTTDRFIHANMSCDQWNYIKTDIRLHRKRIRPLRSISADVDTKKVETTIEE